MLALSPYPKILCIWPNTSPLWKKTKCTIRQECLRCCFPSVRSWSWLERVADQLAGGFHVVSLPRCFAETCTVWPCPVWVCPVLPVRVWVSLLLFWFCCSSPSQVSVSATLWHKCAKISPPPLFLFPWMRGASELTHNSKVSILTIIHTALYPN